MKAAAEPDKNTFMEDEKRAQTTTHQEQSVRKITCSGRFDWMRFIL